MQVDIQISLETTSPLTLFNSKKQIIIMATKILSIEDSDFERKVIRNMMEEQNQELIQASTGEEGIQKFEDEDPALVLLDLRLPDMEGLEVLEEIKEDHPDAKVIIVSIVREDDTIEEAKKLGAEKYIEKPIDEEELLDAIQEVL